ncbi:MAG: DUF1194 domain-containing protein [Rhodospirillales bacterium]
MPRLFRSWFLSAIFVFVFISALPFGAAAEQTVDLELALGVDVSGSIDEEEAALQRKGYIEAFRHPTVIRAIQSGYHRRIAVGYYEWAGYGHNKIIVNWTLIDGEKSAQAFADALTKTPPETASRTSLSGAIDFAAPWFDNNGFDGKRRVIDLSGDGPNNWGEPVTLARDKAVKKGITINGLPIINMRPSPFGTPQLPRLDLYFRDCVIGGRSAFIEAAKDFKDFGRAIRRKLILEISGLTPKTAPKPARQARLRLAQYAPAQRTTTMPFGQPPSPQDQAPPCNIGEYIRNNYNYDDY